MTKKRSSEIFGFEMGNFLNKKVILKCGPRNFVRPPNSAPSLRLWRDVAINRFWGLDLGVSIDFGRIFMRH